MDNKRISDNIKALREAWGESYYDLGYAVGYSKSAIEKFERGSRIPSDETLQKIAKHYMISVKDLEVEDYSGLGKNDLSEIQKIKMEDIAPFNLELLKRFFPVVAYNTNNQDFNEAYTKHVEVFEQIAQNRLKMDITGVIDSYDKAIGAGVIAAAVNELSFLGCLWLYTLATNTFNARIETEDSIKEVYEKAIDTFTKEGKANGSYLFFDRYNSKMTHLMRVVRESEQYKEYSYYFLASRFVYGMFDDRITDLSFEECQVFADVYLDCLYKMRNPYAVELFKILEKF